MNKLLDLVESFSDKNNINFLKKIVSFLRKIIILYYDYSVFAGMGVVIDFILFFILVKIGFEVFVSNCISYFCASTLIYFFFGNKVFSEINFTKKKYIYFMLYQVFSVVIFSYFLLFIYSILKGLFLSKIVLLFITILINRLMFFKIMNL